MPVWIKENFWYGDTWTLILSKKKMAVIIYNIDNEANLLYLDNDLKKCISNLDVLLKASTINFFYNIEYFVEKRMLIINDAVKKFLKIKVLI